MPLLSQLRPTAARAGLSPGAGSGALEAVWPSTDYWSRPGALGLGGCRDTGPPPPVCSQPCVHVPSSEGGRPTWAWAAASAELEGWQLQGEEGGSTKHRPRHLPRSWSSQPGQTFPGLVPGFVLGPRVGETGWQEASQGGGKHIRTGSGGGDTSPILSSSSVTYRPQHPRAGLLTHHPALGSTPSAHGVGNAA